MLTFRNIKQVVTRTQGIMVDMFLANKMQNQKEKILRISLQRFSGLPLYSTFSTGDAHQILHSLLKWTKMIYLILWDKWSPSHLVHVFNTIIIINIYQAAEWCGWRMLWEKWQHLCLLPKPLCPLSCKIILYEGHGTAFHSRAFQQHYWTK